MWDKTLNIFKSAASMLQTGKTPPNTPSQYKEELGEINFLRSRKFFMTFFSIVILVLYVSASTVVLFLTAPFPELTVPFVTMFTKSIEILAIILGTFLGIQTAVDLKYNSSSSVELKGDSTFEEISIEEKHEYIDESRSRPEFIN